MLAAGFPRNMQIRAGDAEAAPALALYGAFIDATSGET
jgi:hypothetical protein